MQMKRLWLSFATIWYCGPALVLLSRKI